MVSLNESLDGIATVVALLPLPFFFLSVAQMVRSSNLRSQATMPRRIETELFA